jgi:RNA polymerase sigma-70 factor (ECF subfamily)
MLAYRPMMDDGGTSSVQESDEDLIGRLAGGDLHALETLYARYARPVFSLAVRMLGDDAEAEEVTQDVFERAWRNAPSFDSSRGRFATWLLSMTHHVAIDALRKRQRRPQAVGGDTAALALQLLPDPRVDVAAATVEHVEGAQIRRALRALPDSQRQAIELAYFGGLSHLEIAAALGDPLGTVKARIRRGMERLRTALEEVGLEGREV